MILTTQNLIIRKFTNEDLDDFSALMAIPEVMRFSTTGPLSKEQAKEYLQNKIIKHYEKGFGLWAVTLKENRQLVGFAGLSHQMVDGQEEVEYGYRLNPAYWGKGYATEAGFAICKFGFDTLKVPYLVSIIDPNNQRSLNVAGRLGLHLWKKSDYSGIPVNIFRLESTLSSPI